MDGLKRLERLAELARTESAPESPALHLSSIISAIEERQSHRQPLAVISLAFVTASGVAAAVFFTLTSYLDNSGPLIDSMYSSVDPLLQLTSLAGL